MQNNILKNPNFINNFLNYKLTDLRLTFTIATNLFCFRFSLIAEKNLHHYMPGRNAGYINNYSRYCTVVSHEASNARTVNTS